MIGTITFHAPVPIEKWGKDHWSTFAYIETRTVDHHGDIDHSRMRCDRDRHPRYHGERHGLLHLVSDTKYPTRLKGGVELHDHDDYDCVDDMIAAGLVVEFDARVIGPHLCLRLTQRGQLVAGQLRAHKARGGRYATFQPQF